MRLKKPFNRKAAFYHRLIENEAQRVVIEASHKITGFEDEIDQQYHLTMILRDLLSLLKDSWKMQINYLKDKPTLFSLRTLESCLMWAILELDYRFKGLREPERYDTEYLYLNVLNKAVPAGLPFYHTIHYYREEALKCIREEHKDHRLRKLASTLYSKITEVAGKPSADDATAGGYAAILSHLENAFFLMAHEAAFIKKGREQLLDADYCREWVVSTQQDFIMEDDVDEATSLLTELQAASSKTKQLFQQTVKRPNVIEPSEALSLMKTLERIEEEAITGKALFNDGDGITVHEDGTSDFLRSFRKKYVTVQEMEEVFGVKKRSLDDYVREGNIRYAKLSKKATIYWRKDVERFIEESVDRDLSR